MSKSIKSAIEIVKDNIRCLEDECDYLHYEVCACYHQNKLFEYELTLKELDKSYYVLENLKQKYKVQLRKDEKEKREKRQTRSNEMVIPQLLKGNTKSHLENEEIALDIDHVEDNNTENQLHEDDLLVSNCMNCIEHKTDIVVESFVESVPTVQEKKIDDGDIIEVEHIEFIIPENLFDRSQANQFLMFFATELIFLKKYKKVFSGPSQSCRTLAFYKTRGRVFSNKGRMMGNENKKDLFYLLVTNLVILNIRFKLTRFSVYPTYNVIDYVC